MFPISSTTLSGPNPANFPLVSPTAAVDSVSSSTIAPVGSAIDAPAQASVQVDLSPVANFLLTVSQSREQIAQLQTAVANGTDPQEAAARAATLNDATQNVVNAFNLLPSVEFNQAQPQGPSLLNNLVESLNRQTFGANTAQQLNQTNQANQPNQPQSAAQSLAQSLSRIGVTLQPPLLSDAAAGLSLDNEILRASFNTDNQATTNTLQNTLDTFSELATRFAEQLSAAGSGALPALASAQQDALTPQDLVANARLDMARAELDLLRQIPLPDTAADRLAAQRADLEQPLTPQATAPDSPIVNPLQASTAEVIAAQNAEAREANINALPSQQTQTARSLQAADQAEQPQAADAAEENQATANANTERSAAQAASDAAQATAAAQAARQQAASGLSAATAASAQAATQANAAQNAAAAAAAAAAANSANATAEQQAVAAQNAATNLAAADAAAASALAQAQAAQSAADALAAQSAEASAAAAQARAALAAATTPEAANAAGAIAAQQAAAAQTTASNLAAANAAAADAAQQARAAQVAAVQASTVQTNPLQGNPALAAAIAAYNITDPTLLGANARATQTAVSATPRVSAVTAPARARTIGPGQ